MTDYEYKALIEPDPDGGFLVTFPDVPEAITAGETMDEAIANASEALGLALRSYPVRGRALPVASAEHGTPVAVDAEDAIKLAVLSAFQEAGISKTELAKRLGKTEGEARRILDPDHPTKLGQMQQALRALGKQLFVSVRDAA